MARYQPDDSYKGLGDDYYDWGCAIIGNIDGMHVGPNGELLILERKNSAYEIERDVGQKHIFQRLLKGNPGTWVIYAITRVVVVDGRVVLQVVEAYKLRLDGNLDPLIVVHRYGGNAFEICKMFDEACLKIAYLKRNGGRYVPDYGKNKK